MRPDNLWRRSTGTMSEEQNNFYAGDGAMQIGLTLKKARQELGLSHGDVERVTKIRARYLEAMERDDYDSLPGAVYAHGFLKTYANYLDLDGERLSRELKEQRASQPEGPTKNVAGENANGARTRPVSRYRGVRRRRFSVAALVAAVLGLLVLVGVVAGLYFVGLQALTAPEEPQESPARVEEEPTPSEAASENESQGSDAAPAEEAADDGTPPDNATPGEAAQENAGEQEAASPSEPPPPAPAPEKLTLTVRVEGNISWLNIKTDGNPVFVDVAQPGFSQTFEADDTITVWSGNAGAVFIEVNGQDYGQLGESGHTVIQDFTLKTAEN